MIRWKYIALNRHPLNFLHKKSVFFNSNNCFQKSNFSTQNDKSSSSTSSASSSSSSNRTRNLIFITIGLFGTSALAYEFHSVNQILSERDVDARTLKQQNQITQQQPSKTLTQAKSKFTSFPIAYMLYKLETAEHFLAVAYWGLMIRSMAKMSATAAKSIISNGGIDTCAILLPSPLKGYYFVLFFFIFSKKNQFYLILCLFVFVKKFY